MSADDALGRESAAHEQRLLRLGVEPPNGIAPAILNERDHGIAVWIPAGPFLMGSEDEMARPSEKPAHQVTVSGFYLDLHPVTNAQYARFVAETGHHPPKGGSPWTKWRKNDPPEGYEDHPVVLVSWLDAVVYCEWSGKRLPTEAEWEKAARGGLSHQRYPWGQELAIEAANYEDAVGKTTAVGIYPANGYGLVDMAGNVWEWCADWYEDGYYAKSPDTDPQGPQKGSERVLRGGCWHREAASLRCSNHYHNAPKNVVNSVGFRCARTL